MKFLDRLRNLFEGPPHISDGEDDAAEVAEDLGEEMPDAQEDVESVERAERHIPQVPGKLGFQPEIGAFENAEHEHDDSEPEHAPPDVNS